MPPLRKHPSLLLSITKDRISLIKEHLKLDLADAQRLWNKNKGKSLEEISKAYHDNCCRRVSILYAFVRRYQPKTIVETGVQNGFSSAFILQGIQDNGNGRLYSIDLPNVAYKVDATGRIHKDEVRKGGETGFVVPNGLRKNWQLILGDARTELPRLLQDLTEIDCFYHDSQHTYEHMTFELSLAWAHMPKGLILCDDSNWNSAFPDFCKSKNVEEKIYENIGFILKSGAE